MDEMNNVMMENETSTEVAPVESVVPAEAENPTYNDGNDSDSSMNLGTVIKVGAGVVIIGAVAVKYGVPLVKKGFKKLKSVFDKKGKDDIIEVESKEVTSEEENDEE